MTAIQWEILAPLFASLLLFVVTQLANRTVAAHRLRDFSAEPKIEKFIDSRFALPILNGSAASNYPSAVSNLVSTLHHEAISAQNAYHSAVTRSAACLAATFCALALSASPLNRIFEVEISLAWLDVIGISAVIGLYFFGRRTNEKWIRRRVAAELARQYEFITPIFPITNTTGHQMDVTSHFEAELAAINQRVTDNSGDLASRIGDFWLSRRRSISNHALSDVNLSADALLLYLDCRPLRQLRWFVRSLESGWSVRGERRKTQLLCLYYVALLLAIAKLIFVAGEPVELKFGRFNSGISFALAGTALLPMLLITTGLAGAMTAYYIYQNARSLILIVTRHKNGASSFG